MLPIYVSGFCLSNEAGKFKSFLNNDLPIVLEFDLPPNRRDMEAGLSDADANGYKTGGDAGIEASTGDGDNFELESEIEGDQFTDIMTFGRLSRALSHAPMSVGIPVPGRRASRRKSARTDSNPKMPSVGRNDIQANESSAR